MIFYFAKPSSINCFILIFTIIALTNSIRLCLLKKTLQNDNQHFIITDNMAGGTAIQLQRQSQLRSYHPQYINSYSYPSPLTPHIYYGEIKHNKAIFLFNKMDSWNPFTLEALTVNGIEYTDASAKTYLLRRQEQYRYMLVFQMENSYIYDMQYNIKLIKRVDHFLIIFSYKDIAKAFLLYITKEDKILQMTEKGLEGLKLYIRNESQSTARQNWRLSQNIVWIGKNNIQNQKDINYRGIILQLQYPDQDIKKKFKINLLQLHLNSQHQSAQLINIQPKINLQTILPKTIQKVQHNRNCADAATQKIFQGLSYQYGSLRIKNGKQTIPNEARELLSFSPSRKRFPWGFLWDDGFHCEVAIRKDEKLVLKVIKSWLDTMLENGWIPRQQNRGSQRQHLCNCPRFLQKDIRDGNPPTLILALDYLRRKNRLNKNDFGIQYWAKVKKWYQWFMFTQKNGDVLIFKWHDSIDQNGASFNSGMDDFPRPLNPKGHIDLQSWMYFFTKFMVQSSLIFDDSNMVYISNLELIKNNFQFFYDANTGSYRDIDLNDNFSPHFGYPNILPIAFGILQYQSRQYNSTLKMIKQHLDTGNGLSSISMKSPFYLANSDAYWKGPVWININYLFLRGLKLYYTKQAQYFAKISKDLVQTVCKNWQKNGFFYENYIQGKGSFSYPFNGWTSLIAIISTENY